MIFLAIFGMPSVAVKAGANYHRLSPAVCLFQVVSGCPTIPGLREQVYAITSERRLRHPAIQAISQAARDTLA